MAAIESILLTIKNLLGDDEESTDFDSEITSYINMAFSNLNDLGVGPKKGFMITGRTELWSDYFDGDSELAIRFESVKVFIQLKVALIFDPPTTSFVIDAMERQISKIEWLLAAKVDSMKEEGVINVWQ